MSTFTSLASQYLEWLAIISIVLLVATLILVPTLVASIPADYFCHDKRITAPARHPLLRLLIASMKNTLGAVLVASGLIMLITPGQGLLTLLIGLTIMNYPGKYRLERWIICRLQLLSALNWIRKRLHKPPLINPRPPGESSC